MKKSKMAALLLTFAAVSCSEEVQLPRTDISEVPFTATEITDAFWAPRIETNRTVSIPSALYQCDINGRFDNFAIAGGLKEGEHRGDFSFDDTDPYKVIEGASYSLAAHYDAELDKRLDDYIAIIASAQEPDGYLCTCVTNKCYRLSGWWGTHRWEKINSHELYNCGHLYEAAVAHYRATGKRTLLDVALKNADLVCQTFGDAEGQIHRPGGHPIVEMGLAKLYKVTGEQKYLDEARYFVEETGRCTDGHAPSMYSQDHMPILEQEEIVGHAVRAGYLYSGVADVAALTHDADYFAALTRIWNNMASKKLYLTGGIGSRAQGEGFGPEYELHNHQDYAETCASIANVYWNHRMFLYTGDSKYIDVLEMALYNGVMSGVSLSGDKFFYDNPLESMGQHGREPWFGCACCPGNVTRFVASVPNYMYATTATGDLYVNLYIQSSTSIDQPEGKLSIAQATQYPWDGSVQISVNPDQARKFSVRLRIPGWAKEAPVNTGLYTFTDKAEPFSVSVNGKKVSARLHDGYVVIDREWKEGDVISLDLPMPVRRVKANEKVHDDLGKLAIMRGPVVYCLEGVDQQNEQVFDKYIKADAQFSAEFDASLLGGVTKLTTTATSLDLDGNETDVQVTAIPYSTWCNRGSDEMAVWIPECAGKTHPKPLPTIASEATSFTGTAAAIQKDAPETASSSDEYAWGVNDQWEPESSSDISKPYFYWWLKFGCEVSLGYDFHKPVTISEADVYWLDFDHYDGNFRVPESWKLYYLADDGTWQEVSLAEGSSYGTEKDKYNEVSFSPVTTTKLNLVAKLQEGQSGGVIEWKVE